MNTHTNKGGTIHIRGGTPLSGTVTPVPNKNSFVAALPAALLSPGTVTYHRVPETLDVEKILRILSLLGATVEHDTDTHTATIDTTEVNTTRIDQTLGSAFRASLMFAGPLVARFGEATIPMPGGCTLGFRGIEAHADVFQQVGISVTREDETLVFARTEELKDHYVVRPLEVSVTATENLIMYAAGIASTVEITDAACEPHVRDLCEFLVSMGVSIDGIGSNHLTINGTPTATETTFTAQPDFVDIAGYIVAAAITDGEIRITDAHQPTLFENMYRWFRLFGISLLPDGTDLIASRAQKTLAIDPSGVFPLASADLPKLAPRPWPGFPVDVIPVVATLACKSSGRMLLQNWMYEDGLQFVRELNALGADIFLAGPQRILVNGPVTFTGGTVTPPRVIQGAMAVFLASLCDPAETTIHNVDILKRRYQNIFGTYQQLGADIELIE